MKSTLGKVMGALTSPATFAAVIASAKDAKKYTTWSQSDARPCLDGRIGSW
jgi:hypothetical protein